MPICWICDLNFLETKFLIYHLDIFHDLNSITVFKCKEPNCYRTLSNLNAFKRHLKSHNGVFSSQGSSSVSYNSGSNLLIIDNNVPNNNPFTKESVDKNDITCSEDTNDTLNKFKEMLRLNSILLASKWYNESGIPRNKIQELLDDVQSFIYSTLTVLKKKVLDNFNSYSNNNIISEMFNSMLNPFENIDTEYLRLKTLDKMNVLIRPNPIIIGHRLNDKLSNGRVVLESKDVNVYFIPLRDILKKIMEHSNLFNLILTYYNNLTYKNDNNLVSNFIQSKVWKIKLSKNSNKIIFPIFLYYDDFEVNDPLGSHAGSQKLGAVYFSIPCIPPELASSLDYIYLALLFKTDDKNEYGNFQTFKELISELNYLENVGICIQIENTNHQIFFSLGLILGDNLGLHSILGFTGSFVSNFPCRFCKLPKELCHETTVQCTESLRNAQNYENDVNTNNMSLTGIKENCVWNNISSFHVTENYSVDIMHDLFEGVCKYEISSILYKMIVDLKYFSLETLNNKIECFNYGTNDIRNRPPLVTMETLKHNSLKMSASETICFTRYLSLIIGESVPENSEFWHLYILLKKIVNIVLQKMVCEEEAFLLHNLISEHHELYLKLFRTHLKPKHHHMLHYPMILKNSGPISLIWSMRFEAKHKMFKDSARAITSRKNIPYTLSLKHQLKLSSWFLMNEKISLNSLKSGKIIKLSKLQEQNYKTQIVFYKNTYFNDFNIDLVTFVSFVHIYGSTYNAQNMFVLLNENELNNDMLPKFGCIENVFLKEKIPYIICKLYTTSYFDDHYQAFKVQLSNEPLLCIAIKDLPHENPTTCTTLANNLKFVNLR